MIKRAHRLLLGTIMASLLVGCCCVYTSTGTVLTSPSAGEPDQTVMSAAE